MKTELRLFVYGTLKQGFANHDRYCGGVLRIMPACLCGRLLKLTPEIPVMVVPEMDILALGSRNFAADLELQERFQPVGKVSNAERLEPAGEWKMIAGELLFFDDPETRLPLIDDLEEFRPDGESTYVRVLVRVILPDGSITTAWTYIAGFDTRGLGVYEGENWLPEVVE